jgi:hypothetical protein
VVIDVAGFSTGQQTKSCYEGYASCERLSPLVGKLL